MRILGTLLGAVMLTAMPVSSQSLKVRYLHDADQMCRATLTDGTAYEMWKRVLVTERKGQPIYVRVYAYYKPSSGEFLPWNTGSMFEHEYASAPNKDHPLRPGASCELPYHHILLMEDGEWADFWAWNGTVRVFHSNLRFETREKAWSYVTKHWQDGTEENSSKLFTEILLYQQLGYDFFRPKKLEFDARPYTYESLVSVKKLDSNWELEIKGADEPNRATVLLDGNFKLLTATKNLATH